MTTATNTRSCPDTLIFYGSPRKDGATALLCKLYEQTHEAETITVVDCFERSVLPCDDCRACRRMVGCVKHDMDDIYRAIERADRLVFLTPVYNRSFPAPMKAVIDRFQCYWSKRFIHGIKPAVAHPKTVAIVTVCGSDRDDGRHLEEQLSPLLTLMNIKKIAAIHVRGTDETVDLEMAERELKNI